MCSGSQETLEIPFVDFIRDLIYNAGMKGVSLDAMSYSYKLGVDRERERAFLSV